MVSIYHSINLWHLHQHLGTCLGKQRHESELDAMLLHEFFLILFTQCKNVSHVNLIKCG